MGCIVGGFLFGLVLPLISIIIEVYRVKTTIGIMDNLEVLYTYLRFPMYWAIGVVQVVISGIKLNAIKESDD